MWDQHVEPVLAALKAGKHVFLEKPMAATVPDCRRIVRTAQRPHSFFMVGHICRFNPRYAVVKQEIVDGRIVSVFARRNLSRRSSTTC